MSSQRIAYIYDRVEEKSKVTSSDLLLRNSSLSRHKKEPENPEIQIILNHHIISDQISLNSFAYVLTCKYL